VKISKIKKYFPEFLTNFCNFQKIEKNRRKIFAHFLTIFKIQKIRVKNF